MNNNVSKSPQADVAIKSEESHLLASRWSRLWASLLDSLIRVTFLSPAMYFTGGFSGLSEGVQRSIGYNLVIGLLGLGVFILINGKLLIANGQTIGKKLLGIRIVDLNGDLPELKKHLIKRYAVFFIPGQVPAIGQFFSIINILFIFGKQKRCVHDLAAGTKVVEAKSQ
jgi:uncharacterized RDD family membrane protein YckC